ncbi:hypothetical protein O6H91_01G046500 [Diphasiastrum complanatum]|uniref:Uncharacterized protein n=1 Tax=Diphasiastrum complanatum TaxID=34168 RepID=A0ACC2EQT7_DIPCM|nr:hypothetical protein O6H91_01G046500 [Diphasiastrum complanatum]
MEQPTMQDDLAAEEHLHWENTVSAISSDPFVYHVNRWTNWHNNSHQIALHQSRPLVRPQPPTEITQAFGNLMAPKIVRKLDDPDLIVRQKAMAWAVEYLSTPENRARCFAAGLLPALMRRFVDKDLCIQRRLALAFKYVAATQSGREEMNQMGAIMELVKLLSSKDCQSRESALEALHDALYSEKVRLELVNDGTILKFILQTIDSDDEPNCIIHEFKILFRCLKVGMDPEALSQLLGAGAISTSVRFVSHPNLGVKESAARFICLLGMGRHGRAMAVEEKVVANLLPMLNDNEPRVQAAAAAALMSITINVDAKKELISHDGVPAISHAFSLQDDNLCLNILQLITNMGEHPVSRTDLQAVHYLLNGIIKNSPSAIMKRCAKRAIRQLLFKHLPFT